MYEIYLIVSANLIFVFIILHNFLTGVVLKQIHTIEYSFEIPHQYPNNAYMIRNIEVPFGYLIHVEVDDIFTQKGSDFLYIGDGVYPFNKTSQHWKVLSGDVRVIERENLNFISQTHIITIIFTSDCATKDAGFVIRTQRYVIPESTTLRCK